MINRFFRHLKEGFFGVGRHAAMSMSSASAVTITLILISIFLIVTGNMQEITQNVEGSVQISAIVGYEFDDQPNLDRIESSIKAIPGVTKIQYSNKSDEFDYLKETYDSEEAKNALETYREENPLHDAFYVEVTSGELISSVADQIQTVEGIDNVNYGGDSALFFVQALNSVRVGGFALVLSLSFLAIFLIANTIKLTIYARSNEIGIMRDVGATNGFIRAPFVVEGIIIGALGSIIPILITVFGYIFLYNKLGGILFSELFKLIPPHPFVINISLILLGIGVLVGLIGSFLSVTKYLRWKR